MEGDPSGRAGRKSEEDERWDSHAALSRNRGWRGALRREAQKVAIARALYKDAPFVILDEPTAALDPVAESEIYENFNELINGKTAIYIIPSG